MLFHSLKELLLQLFGKLVVGIEFQLIAPFPSIRMMSCTLLMILNMLDEQKEGAIWLLLLSLLGFNMNHDVSIITIVVS